MHSSKHSSFSARSKISGLIPFSLDMEKILSRSNARRVSTGSPRSSIPRPVNIPVVTTPRMPENVGEWNTALADIKRDYLNGSYRPCSTRCRQLLHGSKTAKNVEPAHLIYLHFYAASALEMQAQSLNISPHRTQLLEQARVHYRRASELTSSEADNASDWSRSSSPTSLFSPAPSEAMWMTRPPSPTSTISSLVSPTDCAPPVKRHKRVAFSFDSVTEPEFTAPIATSGTEVPFTEPFIRPDSPTLGIDEWLDRSYPEMQEDDDEKERTVFIFPEPPKSPVRDDPSPFGSFSMDGVVAPRFEDEGYPFPRSSESSVASRPTFVDPFQQDRSVDRYTSTLSSLQRQINTHLAAVEDSVTSPPPTPTTEDRKLDIKARIERLRANGWQRKRFDASRYEALRERVLADLE